LISKIKPSDDNFLYQDFSISELCKVCGIDYDSGKNHKNVKDTIKKLADKSMWLKLDTGVEVLLRWIDKAWINKRAGIIQIKLDKDMKPYLLHLHKHFTSYELIYTLAMRSQYSIRLYELLKSYAYQNSKEFDIDELKRILFAESYERYPDFKRKVLDIAMREINELSDVFITYEVIKVGRRYGKIKFSIGVKNDFVEWYPTRKKIESILD
jgi:plasmid replication initiation protein